MHVFVDLVPLQARDLTPQPFRALDLDDVLQLAGSEPFGQPIQCIIDAGASLLHGSSRGLDATSTLSYLSVQQGFKLCQPSCLSRNLCGGGPRVSNSGEFAQREVDRHRQARSVMTHWPEEHIVVKLLLHAQLADTLHLGVVAQDYRAMRVRMYFDAPSVEPQVVPLSFFQCVESEHQDAGQLALT